VLGLIGWPSPEERAKDIVTLETRVAEVLMLEAERSGNGKPERATVAALNHAAAGFDWRAYLEGAELGKVTTVWLDSWDVTTKVAAIVAETPMPVLQARLAFATATARAQALNKAMRDADFEFRNLANGKTVAAAPGSRAAAVEI
jgi:putative endopeptidase